jgi:hypothetical protein
MCLYLIGTQSVARAAVAEVSSMTQRLKYMAILDAFRFMGYAMTPVFGWALAYINQDARGFAFDELTTPGLLLSLLNGGLLGWSVWLKCHGDPYFSWNLSCCKRPRKHGKYNKLIDTETPNSTTGTSINRKHGF